MIILHVVKPILIRVQLYLYKCVCWFSLLFSFKNILALTSSVLLTCGYNKSSFLTLSALLLIVRTLRTDVHKLQPHGQYTKSFCQGAMFFSAWQCHLWIVHKLTQWRDCTFPVLLLCFRICFYLNTSDPICSSSKNELFIWSNSTLNSEMHYIFSNWFYFMSHNI